MPSPSLPGSPQLDLLGGSTAPPEVHRLFFALMPDEAVVAKISRVAATLKAEHASMRTRWIPPARYHATMHFLGDHPMLREDMVRSARLAGDALAGASFEWVLDYAATFHGREPPLVLRSTTVPEPLQQLWQRLRETLIRAGLGAHVERSFTPHVTLGYSHGATLASAPVEPVHWRVDRLALIHSVVGRREYQVLHQWMLRSGTAE